MLISAVLFATLTSSVLAATKKPIKKAPVIKKIIKKVIKKPLVKTAPSLGTATFTAKVRTGTKDVAVTFKNLSRVTSISYTLGYNSTNKGSQGIVGSIQVGKQSQITRYLVFGTASSGVFSYHSGISGAYVEATFTMRDGKSVTKTVNLNVPF